MPGGINVAKLVATLTLESAQFEQALHAAEGKATGFAQKVSNVGSTLTKVGGAMTAGITLPVLAFGKSIVDAGMEFEYEMARLNTVAALPQAELDKTADKILMLGRMSGMGATEIAQASYDVVGAMDDIDVSMEIMEAGLGLAVATGGDLDNTLAAIVGTMKAYGSEAGSATEVADKLFTTVDKGVISIDQLTTNLGYGVGTAAIAGVSFDEFLGSIVGLTRGAQTGSMAMTGLNRLILGILKPSASAKKAAEEMGLEFGASALQANGLGGMLEKIEKATGGDAEKMAQLFPLVQGFRAAATLTKDELVLYNEAMVGMGDSTDRVNRALENIFKTTSFNADVLGKTWENFKIVLFDVIKGPLNDLILKLTVFVAKLAETDPKILELGLKLLGLAAVAGPVIMVLGGIVTALGFLLTPVGLVLGVIALLVAGFLKLAEGSNVVAKALEGDWNYVADVFKAVYMKINATITMWTIQAKILIENWCDEVVIKIETWVDQTLTSWDNWAYGVLMKIQLWKFKTVLEFEQWCQRTSDAVNSWIDETLTKWDNWAYNVLTKIKLWVFHTVLEFEQWSQATGDAITTWCDEIVTKIETWVTDTQTDISTWVTETETSINTWVTNTRTSISTWVSERITEFGNLAKEAIGKVTSIVTETAAQVSAALQAGFDLGKSILQGIGNGIESLFTATINKAKGIITSIKNAMIGTAEAGSPARAFIPIGEYIDQGIAAGLLADLPAVRAAGSQVIADLHSFMLKELRGSELNVLDLAKWGSRVSLGGASAQPPAPLAGSAKYMALSGPDFGPSGIQFNFYNPKIADEDSAKALLTEAARKLRLMGVTA